jgi:hypothetical protein
MTKIFDLVNFHAGYGEQVRLAAYYYNEIKATDNVEHMQGYVPIRSHREAFLKLAQAQLPSVENKEKVFMLTGSFGTGKSHLCLMLANYFSLKPTSPEMKDFFSNWSKRDAGGVEKVRNWRGDGRFLVAPVEFGESRPFEDMILSAIQYALEKEGAEEIILNTHFKGALRHIETWEERERSDEPIGVFKDFLSYLGGDDSAEELEELIKGLSENKSTSMALFQSTYEKATGQRLAFRTDNLIAILKDLLSSSEFQKRYKGLVILADEFGYALQEGRVSMSVFQSFAEMSKDGVAGQQLIFIGTGHRRFESYGADSALQVDFRVVQDRVTEVSLQAEELEQIIAALVSPKTEAPKWNQAVIKDNGWLLTSMASGAKKLKLFDYLTEPEMQDQIVKNIYPVHPMATFCLTRMSQELGSAARSVFAFFRKFEDAEPPEGGYSWFVRNTDVINPKSGLSVYTPNLLTRYFKLSLDTGDRTVRPEIRDYIRNYNAAIEMAQSFAYKNSLTKEIDEFTKKVLDLLFVYRVSSIPVVLPTMEFGLNLQQPNEKKQLKSELKSLMTNKIIFLSPSGEYEFRRSDMADLDTLIAEARQDVQNNPINLSFEVTKLANKRWDSFTDAKGHNQDYLGDKRLVRLFATPKELSTKHKLAEGTEVPFWDYIETRRKSLSSWKDRYDGTMIYVICEDDTEIQVARQALKSNNIPTIIVGVPEAPIPLKKVVLDVLAVHEFMESDTYEKLEFQEKALVEEILGKELQKTGRLGDFLRKRERYLEAKGLHWFYEGGKTLVQAPLNEYEPADALMNLLFTSRNTVSHDYLGKAHPKSFSGSKDTALRDAVSRLIEIERLVEIDRSEKENRGEIRFLRLALANYGVLIQKGDHQGTLAYYDLVEDPEKYYSKYPGLYDLIKKLKELKRGQTLNIWDVLSQMTEAPYGLGPYSLALFIGCVFRHFGDDLRLKVNPNALGYSPTNDPDTIIDVAIGKFPGATIERRFISASDETVINGIYNLFAVTPAQAGTQQTLTEAWRSLISWWSSRTRLERSAGIYSDDETASALVNMLSQFAESNNGSQVVLEEIKVIYGYSSDAEITKKVAKEIILELGEDRKIIQERATEIKKSLVEDISKIFQPVGNSYIAYREAISQWYEDLQPDQKLLTAEWQTKITRTVIESAQRLQDIENTILDIIPGSVGFSLGKVDNWSFDQSQNYLNSFQEAKNKIDKSLPKVANPIWKSSEESSISYDGNPMVKYHGNVDLTISTPETGENVRVTKNENPRVAKQFITVEKSKSWNIVVTESCTYQMVAENDHGDFSKVICLSFTNLDAGYKLIQESSPKLDIKERTYRFLNPIDKPSLLVLLKDIVHHIKVDKKLSVADIIAVFEEVLTSDLTDENGE